MLSQNVLLSVLLNVFSNPTFIILTPKAQAITMASLYYIYTNAENGNV